MTDTPPAPASRFSPTAILWASAFILVGLIVVQAGRLAGAWISTARADLVSSVADYTTLTLTSQSSEDVLVVLDGRSEQLYVYRIENQKRFEFLNRYDLPAMFAAGQRIGAGRSR